LRLALERTFWVKVLARDIVLCSWARLACEKAPGGASTEQTPGAKCRAIGACTHSPKLPMSASKIWTQSGDWWIVIINDVILVFSSGIYKNQNGRKEGRSSSRGFRAFIKLFEV